MLRVLAVDLGASSARVACVDIDAHPVSIEILRRFEHRPVRHGDGALRWEWDRITREVLLGLEAGIHTGPVASIGIDAWGVDYGLLDADGALLSAPYCYRDDRTAGWRDIVDRLGGEELYRETGIQLMRINTIFQLAAHDRSELARARHLLMLPELFVYGLTGALMGERTSAGTTSLVDIRTGDWSASLLRAIGVDRTIMPRIHQATAYAGMWRGVPVHLVGGHDTASAVAALPSSGPGVAFVSSGTWMLVGTEVDEPDTSDAAMRANFSNEAGVFDNVRFLKNVMGLWMLEQCRTQWGDPPLQELLREAEALPAGGAQVDATDARFLAPEDMEAEVRGAAHLPTTAGRAAVARCILDSLAAAAASVVRELEMLRDQRMTEVCVVGGGARNELLNRLIAEECGVPVTTGPVEATVLGNALVQGVALGKFETLRDARSSMAAAERG